ncbi:hypothetical protein GW17_00022266 [Ensete ventricosum]|uniref:Uncharacterized protein n=1 Tax=Ensete ventricosum TaxID=4639 RepID=A0A426ZXL1_ENSVE|nr:hypothetical protein B296_00008666 [Ensete ventricosum]RWW13999.1 hypothetical protein GW17_00022266 [Ensete ventricosum]RZS01808.1 hypothetical protein BHM03_00031742 [Ensete ventricosum]
MEWICEVVFVTVVIPIRSYSMLFVVADCYNVINCILNILARLSKDHDMVQLTSLQEKKRFFDHEGESKLWHANKCSSPVLL